MLDRLRTILLFLVSMVVMVSVSAVVPPTKLPESASLSHPEMVEVPVANDGNTEREQAFTVALTSMLVTITNNPNIINVPTVKKALAKPGLYVKQFSYTNKTTSNGKTATFLRITFNSKTINKLLGRDNYKVGAVVAISSKPLTLVWLVKDDGVARILSDEGVDEGLVQILRGKAKELGMPIILPTLDLQDASSVKAKDICKFDINVIRNISQRYGATTIVVGCVKKAILGNTWSSQWLLLQGAKSSRFSFAGPSVASMVLEAMPTIVNSISNVVIPVSGQESKVVIRINNINGLDQYNEIVRYLHGYNQVITQIDLANISATEVKLVLTVKGGVEALTDIFSKQSRLVPNTEVVEVPPGVDLDYIYHL